VHRPRFGRFDSLSLGGIAVFGALAVVLTTVSQALGLNFPIVPYLQFDLGEIAIFLSFFIFGPIPAVVSSFIEFLTLMVIGQNVPIGPILKLIAVLSSLAGVWLGTIFVSRSGFSSLSRAVASGTVVGVVARVALMTVANYVLIVFLYTIPGIMFVASSFRLIGIALDVSNALGLVLSLTAVFNALQLLLACAVSFLLVRLPQVRTTRVAGRILWIVAYTQRNS
jgi:riboflavin transporter FmnP